MPVNIVLNDDKYHAVIINYESLVPELYVDGKLIYGTGTSPANPPKIGEQLTIGDANVILADLTLVADGFLLPEITWMSSQMRI